MSHNSRVRLASDSWLTILPSEFATLDANLAAGINAVDGGAYAPSAAIVLGGSGLTVTGPLFVARGGSLTSQTAGGWVLGDGDFPLYSATHVGRTRKWLQPCINARVVPHSAAYARWTDAAIQTIATTIDQSDGHGALPPRIYVPIRAHNGSTLGKVTVNFRVGWPHLSLPPTMPTVRVLRKDGSGKAVTLTSTASGADANGYVGITKPNSPAAWYQSGGAQAFVVVCDQNNVIDTSQYEYVLEITEEGGIQGYPFALIYKKAVKYATTGSNLTLSTLQTVDGGIATVEGDRVLVKDQLDPTYNGIWVAHAGAWTRAIDFQSAADFSQGVVIPVDAGNANGGSYWQATSTTTTWQPGSTPANTGGWQSAHAYGATGVSVTPTAVHATGFWFLATQVSGTGTSGATEPAWPNSVGQTVVDNPGANQITWTCIGPTASALAFVPRGKDDTDTLGASNTWFFAHGNIWQSILCEFDNIADTRWA
jgi:hypothetical protein